MTENTTMINGDQFMKGFLAALRIVSKGQFKIILNSTFYRAFHEAITGSPDFKWLVEEEDIDFDLLYGCFSKWLSRKMACFRRDLWIDILGSCRFSEESAEKVLTELSMREKFINFATVFLENFKELSKK